MKHTNTKDIIAESFIEIADRKPISKITVKEIADNCGLTTQTVYNYYSDKYDIIFYRYRKMVDALFDDYLRKKIDWIEVLRKYIDAFASQKYPLDAFNSMHGYYSYRKMLSTYLANKMSAATKEVIGEEDLGEKIEFEIRFYAFGIIASLEIWLEQRRLHEDKLTEYTEDEFTLRLSELVPRDLFANVRERKE